MPYTYRSTGYPSALWQNGGSLLSPGPEGTHLINGLGFFGSLSDNEKRLALYVGLGIAFYALGGLAWVKGLVRK